MIKLREIKDFDLDSLVVLHQKCFDEPWDKKAITDLFSMKGMHGLGAFDEETGHLCGLSIFQQVFEIVEIMTLCVAPEWRRKGIAMQILYGMFAFFATQSIDKIILEVRESNSEAISLYDSLGFTVYCVRKDYYGHGSHALMMEKMVQVKK